MCHAVTSRIRRVERRDSSNLVPVAQYRPRNDACSVDSMQSLGKTRTNSIPTRVCNRDLRDVASMAWTATARCVACRAPASPRRARRRLCSKPKADPPPPPPTACGRLRSRRDAHRGLPDPGHATHSRTLEQREASAINDWRRCPRGTRAHTASGIGFGRSPRTLATKPTRLKAAPSTKQRLPKPTPSPRRRDTDHDKRWTARRPHH